MARNDVDLAIHASLTEMLCVIEDWRMAGAERRVYTAIPKALLSLGG